MSAPLNHPANAAMLPHLRAQRPGSELIHSFLALRNAVGWLAMALPAILFAVMAAGSATEPLSSISQSYYRLVSALFVGLLCAIGVFLLFYRGYDGRDRVASAVAGACAIIVGQVPCGEGCRAPAAINAGLWGWERWYSAPFGWLHYGAAALMFAALAYFCFALFPQTDKRANPGVRKQLRNRWYLCCGVVIVIAMALAFSDLIYQWALRTDHGWLPERATFWIETLMIEAFGLSWAIKGESFPRLND